jgi:hypothetical protein
MFNSWNNDAQGRRRIDWVLAGQVARTTNAVVGRAPWEDEEWGLI